MALLTSFNLPNFRCVYVCSGGSPLGSNIIAPMIHSTGKATKGKAMEILLLSYIVSADSLGIEYKDPGMQS